MTKPKKHLEVLMVKKIMVRLVLAMGVVLILSSTRLLGTEENGSISSRPVMSPTGQEIVFSSDVSGSTNLWIMTVNGQSFRKLTGGGSQIDDDPSWSPDGMTIAFSSRLNDVLDVWTIGRDGTNLRRLTFKTLNNSQPVWSPDGTRIAFVSDRSGTNDIWIMNADGTNQTRLTQLSGEESEPSFSPSGADIVFSETANGSSSLFVVTLATGATRSLTGAGFKDWHPSWSSAGIIFSSDRPPNVSGNPTIWIVQGNGTGLRQFFNGLAHEPSWAANGDVLFTDTSNAKGGLSGISQLTGGVPRPLLPNSFNGDLDGNGIIDLKDVAIIQQALNRPATQPYDARDRNKDGKIDALDVRLLTTTCTYDRCASTPSQ